jgi:hypothetical protein
LDEENYEDIGDLKQQEPEMPDIELKPLPKGLKYEFLGADKTYPVVESDELSPEEMDKLLNLLRKHKKVIGYWISDLKGISPAFCTLRIPLEEQWKPVVEPQRRLSHAMCDVVKNEVIKLLDAGIIYPVPHSEWVSPVHCVPKKGGITVVKNEKDELIPQRIVTGWRMCINYRKLNKATRKDHFPLPFIDEMLERLAKLLTIVSLMDTRSSCKFPFIQMINKRQPSHVCMELPRIEECHLVYVMHQPLFKDA